MEKKSTTRFTILIRIIKGKTYADILGKIRKELKLYVVINKFRPSNPNKPPHIIPNEKEDVKKC